MKNFEEWWYETIFRDFSKPRKRNQEAIWLCRILKKLIFLLKVTKNNDLVQKSLFILTKLLDDDPIDIYERLGNDIRDLTLKERENIKKLLKKTVVLERKESI